MPKETSRASSRVQVEPALNAGGLAVEARQTAIPVPRNNYTPEIDPDTALIVRSLSTLSQVLASEAGQQEHARKEKDYKAGQAARVSANEDLLSKPEEFLRGYSDEFRKGWDYQHGLATGAAVMAEVDAEFESNPDAFPTMDLFGKFLSGRLQAVMEGMSDEMTQGMLETTARSEIALRAKVAKYNKQVGAAKTADDWYNATQSEMQSVAAGGGSAQDLHTAKTAAMERASITGVPREEANKLLVEMVENIAQDTGRLDVFDVFDMDSMDVDNPDQTVPGLAKSAKWADAIHDAKFRVASALERERGKKDKEREWDERLAVEDLLSQGKWSEAAARIDSNVRAGIFEPGLGETKMQDVWDARDEAIRNAGFQRLVNTGQEHMIDSMPDMTPSEKKERYQSWAMGIMGPALETGDPVQIGRAMDMTVDTLSRAGAKVPLFEGTFGAMPGTPAFDRKFLMWSELDKRNPTYAASYMSNDELAQMRFYQSMLRSGADAETANEMLARFGSPENLERARRLAGWDRRKMLEYVDDSVLPDAKTEGWNMDASNRYYVADYVDARAEYYILSSGGDMTPDRAYELAAADFNSTHSWVKVPGRGEVVMVPTQFEGSVTDEDREALADLSESLQVRYKEGDRNYDEAGYYAQPDEHGRWTVYKATTHQPVIEPGRGVVQFPSLKQLTGQYMRSQQMSPEEAQRLQEEAQARRQYLAQPRRERERANAERIRKEQEATIRREQEVQQAMRDEAAKRAKASEKAISERFKQYGEALTPKPNPKARKRSRKARRD